MSKRPAATDYLLTALLLINGCASAGRSGSFGGGDADGGAGGMDGSGGGAKDLAQVGGDPDLSLVAGDMATTHPPDLTAMPDLTQPGKGVGEMCGADAECASNKCIDLYQGNRYCVAPCKAAGDCAGFMTSFCEPITAGSANGYCIPRHPAHCASCAADADCGSLSERCMQGPGDIARACHIDCAIDGAAACPNDYTCTAVTDNNMQRKLCMPNSTICLDAIGGFCDRVALPQNCARENATGICTGQRACLAGPKRYDKCGAMAPQFRQCGQQNPAGCMLKIDPSSMNTIQNCGVCGNVCPGQTNTSDALCINAKCDMTCRGDNYDVDKSPNNGCEVSDIVPPGHTQQTAPDRGHKPCDDGPSTDTFGANVPSDARVHTNPAVQSFSGTVGAAPDWWQVQADGGAFCVNDYSVTLTTTGGGNTVCYMCSFITNKKTDTVTASGNGTQTTTGGSASYGSGSTIFFKIEKVCNLPVQETVSYTVRYHL